MMSDSKPYAKVVLADISYFAGVLALKMARTQKIMPTPARKREGICFGELSPAKYPTRISPSRTMTEPARYGSNRLATKTLPSPLISHPNMYTLVPLEDKRRF